MNAKEVNFRLVVDLTNEMDGPEGLPCDLGDTLTFLRYCKVPMTPAVEELGKILYLWE